LEKRKKIQVKYAKMTYGKRETPQGSSSDKVRLSIDKSLSMLYPAIVKAADGP